MMQEVSATEKDKGERGSDACYRVGLGNGDDANRGVGLSLQPTRFTITGNDLGANTVRKSGHPRRPGTALGESVHRTTDQQRHHCNVGTAVCASSGDEKRVYSAVRSAVAILQELARVDRAAITPDFKVQRRAGRTDEDRKSVGCEKSVAGRVDLGG